MKRNVWAVTPLFCVGVVLSGCSVSTDDVSRDPLAEHSAGLTSCETLPEVAPLKELMIVDPSVVTSPLAKNDTGEFGGPLSFHRAMKNLAGDEDVATFTEQWLANWLSPQTVGNFVVPARTDGGIQLLLANDVFWPRVNGKLDMTRAPFRLLAVVNRMDLASAHKPNGEARLVFGLTTPSGSGAPMTVIFEYNLPSSSELTLEAWAARWHALGSLPFGSAYNDALAAIVADYATGPNLSQLRTSEVFISNEWILREFHLVGGALVTAPTAQTPDLSLNNTPELIAWVNANASAILSNTHVVPLEFLGGQSRMPFPGGPTPDASGTQWLKGHGVEDLVAPDVRRAFAKETCNGCHHSDIPGGFSPLEGFYQISPSLPVDVGDGTNRLSDFIKFVELPQRTAFLAGFLPCEDAAL